MGKRERKTKNLVDGQYQRMDKVELCRLCKERG